MIEYDLSNHAQEMMNERSISEEWLKETLSHPDHFEEKADGTVHFYKSIAGHGGRILRVIVNPKDNRIITLFFDRRFKKR